MKISRVTTCKYLGVHLDERLSLSEHIDYICKKIIQFTSLFYKLRNKMPFSCRRNLYYALVYPHLLYGIELYANTNKTNLYKLHILNKNLLRILQGVTIETHVQLLYVDYDTLPIELLHTRQLLIFLQKYLHHNDILPLVFVDYFIDNSSTHNHNA